MWIDISPLDETLDGGGFTYFERTYPSDSLVTLTAPLLHKGYYFKGWLRNGVLVSPCDPVLEVTPPTDTEVLEILYEVPRAAEIIGPL